MWTCASVLRFANCNLRGVQDNEPPNSTAVALSDLANGVPVNLRPVNDTDSVLAGINWGVDRQLSGASVRKIAVQCGEQRHRMTLRGARITGPLDLSDLELGCSIDIEDCYVEGPMDVSALTAISLSLAGSYVSELVAEDLNLKATLNLGYQFISNEMVELGRAKIGGQLLLRGSSLLGYPDALNLAHSTLNEHVEAGGLTIHGMTDLSQAVVRGQLKLHSAKVGRCEAPTVFRFNGAQIDGGVYMSDGFTSYGEIEMIASTIGGQLDFSGAIIRSVSERAISADRSTVNGSVYLSNGFECTAPVSFAGSSIRGQFTFAGGKIQGRHDQALSLEACTISNDLLVREKSAIDGPFNLTHCAIKGATELIGAEFTRSGSDAIRADSAEFARGLFVQGKTRIDGSLTLLRAKIGGQWAIEDIDVTQPADIAVKADGVVVDGSVHFHDLRVRGELRLIGAKVSGQIALKNCTILNRGRAAATLDGLCPSGDVVIEGSLFRGQTSLVGLSSPSTLVIVGSRLYNDEGAALVLDYTSLHGLQFIKSHFRGSVRAPNSTIKGQFAILGGSLFSPSSFALSVQGATVEQSTIFKPALVAGLIDLQDFTTATWNDARSSWPNKVMLRGFSYSHIEATPRVSISERIKWLDRDVAGFDPHRYKQLVECLVARGDRKNARKLNVYIQKRLRESRGWLRVPRFVLSMFLNATTGYGYKPLRLLWTVLIAYGASVVTFSLPAVYSKVIRNPPTLDEKIEFNSYLYSLDLVFTGALLGERTRFVAVELAGVLAAVFNIGGWVIAALLVATFAGWLKKE